jgi:hypothetical protein
LLETSEMPFSLKSCKAVANILSLVFIIQISSCNIKNLKIGIRAYKVDNNIYIC